MAFDTTFLPHTASLKVVMMPVIFKASLIETIATDIATGVHVNNNIV